MADFRRWPLEGTKQYSVAVHGSFRPAGTGAPTNVKGKRFSVARTGVGVFQVTFSDSFNDMEACVLGLREAGGLPHIVQYGDYVAASKTLDIRLFLASTHAAADLAADADNEISFFCVFKNTNIV